MVQGAGDTNEVQKRIAQIRKGIEATDSDYDREKLQERLAKLTGGVAIISVGASSEADMKQKKARVEDALHATRAAVEEGILPGGGVALLRCKDSVTKARGSAKGDEKIGVDIVLGVLDSPLRQIADNCGIDGSVVADEVAQKGANVGYDAASGEYGDMYKKGILDPTKVVKTALSNAASIAALLLTTEAMVTNYDKKTTTRSALPAASVDPASKVRFALLISFVKQEGPLRTARWPLSFRLETIPPFTPGEAFELGWKRFATGAFLATTFRVITDETPLHYRWMRTNGR